VQQSTIRSVHARIDSDGWCFEHTFMNCDLTTNNNYTVITFIMWILNSQLCFILLYVILQLNSKNHYFWQIFVQNVSFWCEEIIFEVCTCILSVDTYIRKHVHTGISTGYSQKNGAVSNVNKK
jgi:hypothetical protein